jgi:hypothetical protein
LPKLTPPTALTAKPVAGLVLAPTAAQVNPNDISISRSSNLVPRVRREKRGIICEARVREVRRKVAVVEDTAHCCVGVARVVGGL